jgi:hypothetical protein
MVMNVVMPHAATTSRSPAHGLFRDSLSAISRCFGIVGRLLGTARRRLSLRRRRLGTLSSRVRAPGRLIGLIGRVDGVLLWRRIARGASRSHHCHQQDGAGQPNQL